MKVRFPKGFIWGAAASAYQIEGGVREGGRGMSVWDTFSHTKGMTARNETGDTAADSYHRWREDVALLREMGLDAYRFSVAWPRVDPLGDGNWNEAGFSWYIRLIDALLEAGVEPWVTLYHWDLPQALQSSGGWQSPRSVDAFARYAREAGERFRGRVRHWFTLNEPQCFLGLGYGSGEHAPGLRLDASALARCWDNVLTAHCIAQDALHAVDPLNRVGVASTGSACYPATPSSIDIEAARELSFAVHDGPRSFSHTLFLDPLCRGDYRRGKPDFIGLNLYHGTPARMGVNGPMPAPLSDGMPCTAMGWPVTPEAMEWTPRFLHERYALPLVVSENGFALEGERDMPHDADRIEWTAAYLRALAEVAEECDVRGYFHWSLLDNFEWAEGYRPRFGLVHVDFATGKRTPKDSAAWYASVVQENNLPITD